MKRLLVTSFFIVLALTAGALAIDAVCVLKFTPTSAPECFTDASNPYGFDGTQADCTALATNGATTQYVSGQTSPDAITACNVGYCCQAQNQRTNASRICQDGTTNSGSRLYSTTAEGVCGAGTGTGSTGSGTGATTVCNANTWIQSNCLCGTGTINSGYCCNGQQRFSACATTSSVTCGNNIRDGTEQCDAVSTSTTTDCTAGQLCSATCTCVARTVTVLGDGICGLGEANSADCPRPPNTCTRDADLVKPVFTASYDSVTRSVLLVWSVGVGGCIPESFLIGRSNTSVQAAPPSLILTNPGLAGGTRSYYDTTIPFNSPVFTYTLIALYNSGLTANSTYTTNTPNSLCPASGVNSCLSATTGVTCNGYVGTVLTCTGNTMCITNSGGAPICAPKPSCATCNGLFGSFPESFCSIFVSGQDACYLDLGGTAVELYKLCGELDSCTDYRTQTACESNVCNRAGSCAWRTIDTATGRGVCGATTPELVPQTCSDCGADGSSCDQVMCNAIGLTGGSVQSVCTYVPSRDEQLASGATLPVSLPAPNNIQTITSNVAGCMASANVPCEFFDTQAMCTGNSIFALNVTYDSNGNRVSGDNAVLTRSNDAAGHGKCVWTAQNVCRRDANDNNIPDLSPIETPNRGPYADYRILSLDFTDPMTSVTSAPNRVYPAAFSVRFVNDSPIDLCFTRPGQPCYPSQVNDINLAGNRIERYFQPSESGNWELKYYGMDFAKNIEQVRTFPFIIDGQGPSITIEPIERTLVRISNNRLRTRTIVRFNTSEQSKCSTTLEDANIYTYGNTIPPGDRDASSTPAYGDLVDAYGTRFVVLYPALIDGTFQMPITCEDLNGNPSVPQTPIIATVQTDSDPTITNPRPVNLGTPFTNSTIAIEISTQANAQCRYGALSEDSDTLSPQAMWNSFITTPYTTTGAQVHRATVPTVTSGLYAFMTVCNITGNLVKGGPGDLVIFGIDRQAPVTSICDVSSSSSCNPIRLDNANSYRLKLMCTDGPGGSPRFGCTQTDTQYCIYSGSAPCTNFVNATVTSEITGTGDYRIRFRSTDAGGNTEAMRDELIRLVDTVPPDVTFTIREQ